MQGAAALGSMAALPAYGQAKAVRIAHGWINNVEYAGVWMAQEMGYFKEEGLDVKNLTGGPNAPLPSPKESSASDRAGRWVSRACAAIS